MKKTNFTLYKNELHRLFNLNTKMTEKYIGPKPKWLYDNSMSPVKKYYNRKEFPLDETKEDAFAKVMMQRFSASKLDENAFLSFTNFSQLVQVSCGVTHHHNGVGFRAYPSPGGLYPTEIYLLVKRVDGLEPGLYHYAVMEEKVALISTDQVTLARIEEVMGLDINGDRIKHAPVTFILSSYFERATRKYNDRGYRYCLMELGHIGQNIQLLAQAMRLGSCCMGGFLDDELNDVMGLDGLHESAMYLISVGKTAVDHDA